MPDFISRKLSKRKRSDVSLGLAMFGLCLLMVSVGYTVSADQPSKMLNGKVITLKDSTAIPNAHIINLNSAKATISGAEGGFWIPAAAGDSIRFQAIGFETLVLFVGPGLLANDEDWVVALEEKIYELPVVEIYPFQTFTEFKYAFLNFKEPDEAELKMELPEVVPEPDLEKMPLGFGGVIPGPITFLYDRFSRRGKALRNYQNVLRQEELAGRAARVVNPQVIERLTGLNDRAEINAFLIHCGITDEYVVNTRDTEVYARIIACYETYVADGK
jgi:hypothetical protein